MTAGALQVDGTLTHSATTVTGATLKGTGTLGTVTLNAGATLMAGDSAATLGSLTTGNLLFNPNATLQFKLDSSLAQSDLLTVTGSLTLNNTALDLTDVATIGAPIAFGTRLTLLLYGDGMGNGLGSGSKLFTFEGRQLTEGSTFTDGINTFQINYAYGDPAITLTSVVPEPQTWLLLLPVLGLLIFCKRRLVRPS